MADTERSSLPIPSRRIWISVAIPTALIVVGIGLFLRHQADTAPAPTDPAEIERQAHDNPDNFRAQLRYGEMLVRQKRPGEASDVLTQASRLSPKDARPFAWMAVAALSAQRTDEARRLIRESLQRDPSNATAIRAQANLDAQERRLRPAIAGFDRLVQMNPNDADAWQRLGLLLIGAGENYRSLDALSHAAALAPQDLFTQRALGNMALQAGRLNQAVTAFRAVLAQEPNSSVAHLGLAKALMRIDPSASGLKVAEQEADAAIIEDPSAEAFAARGQVRMTERRFPEAIKDLSASIALKPEARETYVMLSQCYASVGKPEMARKASTDFERLRNARLAHDLKAGKEVGTTQ